MVITFYKDINMEEQNGNVVKKGTADRPEKMSYEQLENVAHQLSEQSRQLYMKLQAANMNNVFKRLDYLFKVIENGNMFSKDFLGKCINEVEELMTVPEDTKEDNELDTKNEG